MLQLPKHSEKIVMCWPIFHLLLHTHSGEFPFWEKNKKKWEFYTFENFFWVSFSVYAGNGFAFEQVGATLTVTTSSIEVNCKLTCNSTLIVVGNTCYCDCKNDCGRYVYNDDCSCSECSFIDGSNTCQVSTTSGNNSGGGVSTGNNPTTTSTTSLSTSSSSSTTQLTSSTSSGNNNDPCSDFVCQPIICNIVSCEEDSLNNPQCVSTPQENGASCIGGTCQEGKCKAQEVSVSNAYLVHNILFLHLMGIMVTAILLLL